MRINMEASSSALVQGEDSESDEEEINTDHMPQKMETSSVLRPRGKGKPGIVAGEGSETDDEDDARNTARGSGGVEQTDSGGMTLHVPQRNVSGTSSPRSSRRSSGDSSSTFPPQSLLHKKLRERNVSLRKNIVERILRIYHATCRNLTIVNDNLSRNQATIEKVNSHLKKADSDLERVNVAMELTSEGLCNFAPTLRLDIPLKRNKSSMASGPSPS